MLTVLPPRRRKDGDDHGVALVVADRQPAVLVEDFDVGHVAHPQRLILAGRNHHLLDLPNRLGLIVDDDLKGERLTFGSADRVQVALLGDLIGQVGGGQAGRQQVVGPGDDFHFADIAPGDVGVKNVRDRLDERRQLVLGVVAELGMLGLSPPVRTTEMMGKTDGVICSTVNSTLGGSSERLAPMRFQMRVSARRMSVPG
jgi:hypothetical protein